MTAAEVVGLSQHPPQYRAGDGGQWADDGDELQVYAVQAPDRPVTIDRFHAGAIVHLTAGEVRQLIGHLEHLLDVTGMG